MIYKILIFVFLFIIIFTVKEYFYSIRSNAIFVMAFRAAIAENLFRSQDSFREKLIVIYCSGCKSLENRLTIDLFNSLGDNIDNVQIQRIDLSKSNDPVNLIRGFIHPKYLKKDSFLTGTPTPSPSTPSDSSGYEYQIEPRLQDYFHSHNNPNYGRSQTSRQCDGPDFYTHELISSTTIRSSSNLVEYEESEEYRINECDYFLVYKTPTILFEIKDHAYLKFPEILPIQIYPCNQAEEISYQERLEIFIKKIKHWTNNLKEFTSRLIGLYDLVRVMYGSSCADSQADLITNTVNHKDAYYNVIGKYYDILCNAYPKTNQEVQKYERYTTLNPPTTFYREKALQEIGENNRLTDNDDVNLDFLKVDYTRMPHLRSKLALTDPDGLTIRGNSSRLIEFAKRTMVIYFEGYLLSNEDIYLVTSEDPTSPEHFMRRINHIVRNSQTNNVESNSHGTQDQGLELLKDVFTEKGFPNDYRQRWRYFYDPSTGSQPRENYGWFLLTFDQDLGLVSDFEIKLNIRDNFPLVFRPYPVNWIAQALRPENQNSDSLQVRQYQKIIQGSLLEFGFIKSTHSSGRLTGCINHDGQNESADTPPENCTVESCPAAS
jgi:hypothetical protein